MVAYVEKAKEFMGTFSLAFIEVISRSKNENVNPLAKLASTRDTELVDAMSLEVLVEPSIKQQPEIMGLT